MNRFICRRVLLRAALAACACLALPIAHACEFYTTTLRITHPWTRATAPGDTSAVLLMKLDDVSASDQLIGVETSVASGAELIRDGASSVLRLSLPIGSETLLSEEGTHIRLVGLNQVLQVGRSYPLTLIFAKGGRVDAELNVDYERNAASASSGKPHL